MNSYNRVTLIGGLTADPELKQTNNGSSVTRMTLAVSRRVTKQGEQAREETTYIDVDVWGRTAENAAKYLKKGRSVLVEGRLQLASWEDKEGKKRSKLQVIGENLQYLSLGEFKENTAAA